MKYEKTSMAVDYTYIEYHPEHGSNYISGTLILETEEEYNLDYPELCDIIVKRHDNNRICDHEVVINTCSSYWAFRLAFKEVAWDYKTKKGTWERIEDECRYTYWDNDIGGTLGR